MNAQPNAKPRHGQAEMIDIWSLDRLAQRLRQATDSRTGHVDVAECIAVAQCLETYARQARLPEWLSNGASPWSDAKALSRLNWLIHQKVPHLRSSRARLLAVLICHAGSVVSYAHLCEQARCSMESLKVIVANVRGALRRQGLPDEITNHHGAGYAISADAANALLHALRRHTLPQEQERHS